MCYDLRLVHDNTKKKSISWKGSLKFALLLTVIDGGNTNVQSMELAGWVLTSVGGSIGSYLVPESVKETVTQYASWIIGEEKKYTEQFNEFTANRRIGDLNDLYAKNAAEIKGRLLKNFPIPKSDDNKSFSYTKCTQYISSWEQLYQTYVLALLRKDYVDALKLKMETTIDEIRKLDLKQLEENTKGTHTEEDDQKEIIEFLKKKNLNICANFYAKYRYDRKGGLFDKGKTSWNSKAARKKFWGTSTIPAVDERENSSYINEILNSDNEISVIANPVLEIYKEIINFITMENALFFENFEGNRDIYRNKYLEFFNLYANPTPLMDPTLSEYINFLKPNDKIPKRRTKGSQDGSASFTMLTPPIPANLTTTTTTTTLPIPIPIPDNALGTYLKDCTPTQSYSAQDPLLSIFAPHEAPKSISQAILEKEQGNNSRESGRSSEETSEYSSEDSLEKNHSSNGSEESSNPLRNYWNSDMMMGAEQRDNNHG